MKYQAPFGNPGGPNDEAAAYINGNQAAGIEGSIPPAGAFEYTMRELVSLIKAGSMATSDSDLTQVLRSVRGQVPTYAVDTGIANALAWMMTPPSTQYAIGMLRRVKVKFTNTGICTGNDSLLGNVPIVHGEGSVMVAGELPAGAIIDLVFDGTNFQLTSVTQAGGYIGYINSPITKTIYGAGADFPDLRSALYWASRYIITQTGYITWQITPGQHIENAVTITIDHPNAARMTFQGGTVTQPVSADFAFTGNTGAALSNDQANQLVMLRTKYNTEIRLTNGSWMDFRTGGRIQNLLITGDGSFPMSPGGNSRFMIVFTNDVYVTNVSVHGSGGQGLGINGARCCFDGGTVTFSGCVGVGLIVYSALALESILICASNTYMGLGAGDIGFNVGGQMYIQGNGDRGASIGGSVTVRTNSQFKNNRLNGAVVQGGLLNCQLGVNFTNNGYAGISAVNGGMVLAQGCTFSGNTSWSVEAKNGSNVDVATSSFPGTSMSPVLNTVGNGNSFISG